MMTCDIGQAEYVPEALDMTDSPARSRPCVRTGTAPCAWSPTPTTWSSAPPPRWRAGPARASGRLLHGHQRRGRHRRHGPRGVPRRREEEQRESARVVGVDEVEFLGLPTASWSTAFLCAPRRPRGAPVPARGRDHRQLPRHVGRRQPQPGRPHRRRPRRARRRPRRRQPLDLPRADRVRGPRALGRGRRGWANSSPLSTHGVDTTDTFDAGVASLEAHRAYIDGLGWEHFDPREFLEGMARQTGQRLGVGMAAAFEVFPMGWGD